ncbi:iron-containing alcohol dehydrogenase [Kribbella sp.]|uniref:iron-containing alcohol dehydrogenase n=1 Tax=Kribbella sp. TaxID=1871183 RepID=UPI002D3037E2|nr:iron-containing alcohol dehydrogenase [Kribbella sp.]HZX02113.1 iron-containing alcohol dehydrogenase [Kribbella sp.]
MKGVVDVPGRANAVAQWGCRTRICAGEGALDMVVSGDIPRQQNVLVLGSGFAAANFRLVDGVRRRLKVPADRLHLIQAPATVEQVETLAALLTRVPADNVVAIGGTAALDVTKLACHQLADDRTLAVVRARGAGRGVITLPFEAPARVRQILVPTTFGSAAELSPHAAVRLRGQQRVVYGGGLPPSLAAIDSGLTKSLARQAVLDGLLMSLARFVDPYVDGDGQETMTAVEAQTATSALASLGLRAQAGDLSAPDRLLASYLNVTQVGPAIVGRHPYVSKAWAVTAELIGILRLRPAAALGTVLPSIWRRIDDGDDRFGDRERLRRAWGWIRTSGYGHLPADPANGVAALIRSWGIDSEIVDGHRAARVTGSRAARFWGGNQSPLTGIPAADLTRLVSDALSANAISDGQ